MRSLNRRIERLEKARGGDLEAKMRALALRLGIPAERLAAAVTGHSEHWNREISMDGTITWTGFCHVRQLGVFQRQSGQLGASVCGDLR